MPPVKVLYLLPDLDVRGDGMAALAMAGGLDRQRFQAHIGCLGGIGPLAARVREHNIPLHLLSLASPLSPGALLRLRGLLRDLGVHIVHTIAPTAREAGRLAARMAGVPVIVAHYRKPPSPSRSLRHRLEQHLDRRSDLILCADDSIRANLAEREGMPPETLRTLHDFVEPRDYAGEIDPAIAKAELGVPADVPSVGIIGRLEGDRGHDLFLQAARQLVEEDPAIHFAVVGDGPSRAGIEARVREMGLTPHLTFTNTRQDMPRVYRALDVLVCCSQRGGGRVVLESQAAGVPVVALKNDATAEALATGGGLLVTDPSTKAFAAAIDHALQPEPRRALREQAFRNVRRFAATRVLTELEDLYLELCEKKHALQRGY